MDAPDETEPGRAEAGPEVVVPGTGRPSRSAKRIVAVVVAAAVVLAGLAVWVLAVPYPNEVQVGDVSLSCDGIVEYTNDAAGRAAQREFEESCRQPEEDRRNLALLIGAGVAIAACAVSTIPSRRLSGEKLGPLR